MEHKSGPGSQQPHSPHSIPASPASAELRDPSAHRPLSPMARATSSLRAPLLRAALLLLLLTSGQKGSGASLASELRCQCLKTVPGVHPKSIQSVKVSAPGPHCTQTEVIAMLKNGQEVCLNPESPMVQKIIHKLLNRTVILPAEQGEEEAHAAVPETDLALLRQS